MQRGSYKRFAYAISVRSSGHGGGRWASGILLKAAVQMCFEDLFVRTLRKVLLVHDIRSRSIGWRRENICSIEYVVKYRRRKKSFCSSHHIGHQRAYLVALKGFLHSGSSPVPSLSPPWPVFVAF